MAQTPSPVTVPEEEETSKWTVKRVAIFAGAGFAGFVLLLFIISIIISIISTDIEHTANIIQILRDIFIIILAFQSIVIALALVILVIQVAGLVNLLQTEIKPILENIQATLNSAKGTIRFVGDNVAVPVAKAGGFFAGLAVFMRDLGGLRKAVQYEDHEENGHVERD